jgi:hypothetical protein
VPKALVHERAAGRGYGMSSEYMRESIRKDRDRHRAPVDDYFEGCARGLVARRPAKVGVPATGLIATARTPLTIMPGRMGAGPFRPNLIVE